jgi:periplasmic protein TonB
MAFEAILSQQRAAPSKWRRITLTFSLLIHALALAFGVVHSIWQVDEMPMPAIEVTLSVAPPPPPPPPPPPKRSSTKPKTKPVDKPKVITAPKEVPKTEPEPAPEEEAEDEGDDQGVEGGVIGGVVGGIVGGTAPPPPKSTAPKLLSAKAGHSLLAINPQVRPYKVNVPEEFVQRGDEYVATINICVSPTGAVSSVKILKPSGNTMIDHQIPKVIPTWKYRPFVVDGQPSGFCYTMNYRVK